MTFAQDTAQVLHLLESGEVFLRNGHFEKALVSCREGLKTLGDEYSSPDLLDDTDMKLLAAEIQEAEGKLGNAATVTCRILRSRIELWERKR